VFVIVLLFRFKRIDLLLCFCLWCFADIEVYRPLGLERISPTSFIKYYIPDVDDELKPKKGMRFESIDDAYIFYQKYSKACGFSIRKSAQYGLNGIHIKYFVCSKEGFQPFKKVDTLSDDYKAKKIDVSLLLGVAVRHAFVWK